MEAARSTTAAPRVLLVEDEFLIAQMVGDMLSDLDCVCVGPIMTMHAGVAAAATEMVDAAIINLLIEGELAYPVVEELMRREIPFCFASGASPQGLEEKWRSRPFIRKPYVLEEVRAFLDQVLGDRAGKPDVTAPAD